MRALSPYLVPSSVLTRLCPVFSTFSIESNHEIPSELVSAIKAFLLSAADYAKAVKKESPPKGKLDAPSAEWIRKIIDQRMGEYDTAVEVRPISFFARSPSLARWPWMRPRSTGYRVRAPYLAIVLTVSPACRRTKRC